MGDFAVILAAAGQSSRFGNSSGKKPFVELAGKPVWLHSAEKFAARSDVKQLVIVVSPEDESEFRSAHTKSLERLGAVVVAGGAERMDSVANGIRALDTVVDFVAIHDAARPCVSNELIECAFEAIETCVCVIPALPVNSTVKRSSDGGKTVAKTEDRSTLFLAQTPQIFSREVLIGLFQRLAESEARLALTDEAQLAEHFGVEVCLVSGCEMNLKLTRPIDLRIAESYIEAQRGIRFDAPPSSTRIV
jgi:2-C-methyl-D-erythritol 4-phosphate cytidylyltransferase